MSQDNYDTLEIVKYLEMKELEEEETWIQNLKSQRERIEKFKFEIDSRDQKILELTAQLEHQKLNNNESKKLQAALERAEQQIRDKEQESINLKEVYDKRNYANQVKVEELEKKLKDNSVLIKNLQNEILKTHEITHLLNSEKQELKSLVESATQQNLEELEQIRTENEMLKGEIYTEQIQELKETNIQLDCQIREIYYIAHEQEKSEEELTMMIEKYRAEVIPNQKDAILIQYESLKRELISVKETKEDFKKRSSEDMNVLKTNLNFSTDLVKRQQTTILTLKSRIQEDEAVITDLKSQMDSHDLKLKLALEQNQLEMFKLKTENSALKNENADLSTYVKAIKEREDKDRKQRQEWVKMKRELMDMRNYEVEAINQALEAISPKFSS